MPGWEGWPANSGYQQKRDWFGLYSEWITFLIYPPRSSDVFGNFLQMNTSIISLSYNSLSCIIKGKDGGQLWDPAIVLE